MTPDAILDLRQALGWSQRQLAVELGVSSATVAHWERGFRAPTGSARKLLEIFASERKAPEAQAPLNLMPRTLRGLPSAALWLALRGAFGDEQRGAFSRRLRLASVKRYAEALGELRALAQKIGQT